MNQINLIQPYLENNVWKFDDEKKYLRGEPFVSGIPSIINYYVQPRKKFDLYFSKSQFPYWNVKLHRVRLEFGGAWYVDKAIGQEGWLCPALLKYFDTPPNKIFCKID